MSLKSSYVVNPSNELRDCLDLGDAAPFVAYADP
jgi:hypothetical protein